MARSTLAALRSLRKAKDEGKPSPPALSSLPGFSPVAEMTLEDFSRAGLVVRVTSALLGEDVLLVSDNVLDVDERGDLVVYRAEEIRRLVAFPPDCAKTIHGIKKAFPGCRVTDLTLDEEGGKA